MRRFGIAGSSGSGKTTLLEALLPWLAPQGLALACIKHTHHALPLPGAVDGALAVRVQPSADQPGKDSWRLGRAGCPCVILAGPGPGPGPVAATGAATGAAALEAALALVPASTDLVLIEGFKQVDLPTLEVFRPAVGKPPLWPSCPGIVAVATDAVDAIRARTGLPVLDLADIDAIGKMVLRHAQAWAGQRC
ncbi:molybdopterin-guanine dinucleotide biosynthesis protein B [Cupriavidus sp. AU9028]|uniref:molybdopterin-guanine dinucleotide biosynthesis protein B n=1 Tax=Cupriavidus sp. AU9028 TaxID=2871157 RepID=UPI001C9537E6|nr:molybdopterin-guanine dinucleotide biosynthesis protein B [Cupriavidus sp. AU9028]